MSLVGLVNAHLAWVAALILVMYFDKPKNNQAIKIPLDSTLAFSINDLAILYFGIFPSGLIHICRSLFLHV